MPPKRKRAADTTVDAAPKATRASSRLKASTSESPATTPAASVISDAGQGGGEPEPVAKKAKRTSSKAGTASKSKGRAAADKQDANPNQGNPSRSDGNAGSSTAKSAPSKTSGPGPYSEAKAGQLFKAYQDADTPGEIGPEGFEKLCNDLGISLEGAQPLVLAWQLHGSEMAKFKHDEWMKGTSELRVSDLEGLSLAIRELEDLLLLDKPPIQAPSGPVTPTKKKSAQPPVSVGPYNRQKYYQYAADKDKAFSELYTFCFNLAKPPTGRNIDIETASAIWSVLVAPKYPIMNDILKFIAGKGTLKGVNKDLWNMTLEFCRTVRPDLSNYEADGAWPTMLDDFVAWKKSSEAQPDEHIEVA